MKEEIIIFKSFKQNQKPTGKFYNDENLYYSAGESDILELREEKKTIEQGKKDV